MAARSSNATQYAGPEARTTMTDAEADQLRARVPDDPIALPEGCLACHACGISVSDRTVAAVVLYPKESVEYTRCTACQNACDVASAYLTGHPALARRVDPEVAREPVESVLFGLAIIGWTPSADLGLLLPRLVPAAHGIRFANPLTLTRDLCSPYGWAHVSTGQRAELRKAYAAAMADRLALSAPAMAIRCPTIGCAFCGLASVHRAAIEVARRGGVEITSRAVWREVNTNPRALGSNGPEDIWGHLWPD